VYEFIEGRLVSRRPDRVVIDTGGVGWRVTIPLSTFERLPHGTAPAVRLLVVHHQREDRQALFGFLTEDERSYFEMLTEVTGVGPSLAMAVVSTLPFDRFRSAVASGDLGALTRVRGIGKKVAGRILVELPEKVKAWGPTTGGHRLAGTAEDALLALVALGLDRSDAEERCRAAAEKLGPTAGPGDLVREVLRGSRPNA
jgi:Holliday junction DNA helicase RuvA